MSRRHEHVAATADDVKPGDDIVVTMTHEPRKTRRVRVAATVVAPNGPWAIVRDGAEFLRCRYESTYGEWWVFFRAPANVPMRSYLRGLRRYWGPGVKIRTAKET